MDEPLEARERRRQVAESMLQEREPLERRGVARIALHVLAHLGGRLVDTARLQVLVGRGEQVVRHHDLEAPFEGPIVMAAATGRKHGIRHPSESAFRHPRESAFRHPRER